MPPGHAGEFAHNGANEGFQGVAIVANSNNGVPVAREYVRSLAKEYGWEFLPEARGPGQELMMVAKLNVHDSRDEAYAAAGKKELVIANYERWLQLDPMNTNAAEWPKRLKAQ